MALEREGIALKTRKTYQIILLVLVCILANCTGRALTSHIQIFLWLDSLGTICSAYILGPVCGMMVGVTGNLIYSMLFHTNWAYLITSISLAFLIGFLARRKSLDTVPGTMFAGILCAVAATVISVPLNYVFFKGMTGNIWGDGVIRFLQAWKWPSLLCKILGEFYLEFFDKVITLFIVHLAIRALRSLRSRSASGPRRQGVVRRGVAAIGLPTRVGRGAAAPPAQNLPQEDPAQGGNQHRQRDHRGDQDLPAPRSPFAPPGLLRLQSRSAVGAEPAPLREPLSAIDAKHGSILLAQTFFLL